MPFELHPRLAKGCHPLGMRNGCHVLLKDNACFPWMLVVPETEEEDLHLLEKAQYDEVMLTVRDVSKFVSEHFHPEKLNVACIGNIVRQMHIHIVGRSQNDPAWPETVWACDARKTYQQEQVRSIREAARSFLHLH
ncbi:HIT family protein [Haloferula sp.]|uniref:HIT family protein n=1 Tax=Haloferula sp. TaxID=2497595 RepID=UPI003C72701D